ncbi:MAG: hypothetical protein PHW00_04565 [Clostridia bacterium]|nr:hypothetical protein [Clostridia bacterium]
MIQRLRNNYTLSKWLARILYVLCYTFGNWQLLKSSVISVVQTNNAVMSTPMYASFWLVLLTGILSGVVALLILNLLLVILLNVTHVYYLPRSEFATVITGIVAIKHLLLGILNCLYFITPLISVWGGLLFECLGVTVMFALIYIVSRKLYLTNQTAPFFFKSLLVLYSIFIVIRVVMYI